jgi:mono/diheme cytochrome c family protein
MPFVFAPASLTRLVLAVFTLASLGSASITSAAGDAKRGEYVVRLGGCLGCHTEAKKGATPFAGGRALATPFGTFFGPNITPDPQAGIGKWTEADFMRAMRHGERPDGANYFPAFPYPSFTKITDDDLRDIWTYLRTLPPNARINQEHDLRFPFGWRLLVTFWKWLYFTPGPFMNVPGVTEMVTRGAYLVNALGHCGECHTPRNFLGGPVKEQFLAGTWGLDGKRIPNLTPTRLKPWDDADLKKLFSTGVTPDDDTLSEAMDEVIRNTTSQLSAGDVLALIAYLRSLPPLPEAKK